MTPAPMTARRLGTASKSSAPQESTITGALNGALRSSIGAEPGARITCRAAERAGRAVVGREFHLPSREQPSVSLQRGHAGGLEEREDPLGHAAHDARLALLHLREIERRGGHLNPVDGDLLLHAVIQLAGLEQRLGGNAPGIQAGAAKGGGAIAVLPLIDAGHREAVLRGANRGRVARRPPADHDDVKLLGRSLGLVLVRHRCRYRNFGAPDSTTKEEWGAAGPRRRRGTRSEPSLDQRLRTAEGQPPEVRGHKTKTFAPYAGRSVFTASKVIAHE